MVFPWKLALVAVGLACAIGCNKSSTDCKRAVDHVFMLTLQGPKPSSDEQAAIDQIQRMALDRCESEGLSPAQRDCILAAKALSDRQFLMCPALVARPPTWIIAPIGDPDSMLPTAPPPKT